jgi:hypothetical protein
MREITVDTAKECPMKKTIRAKIVFSFLISFLFTLACLGSQTEIIPFDSPRWQLVNAQPIDYRFSQGNRIH